MRRESPAVARNRDPILHELGPRLEDGWHVLEVASGTGEHALYFSRALADRGIRWTPTDADPTALASISAWREDAAGNLDEPVLLDVHQDDWPGPVDAVFNANLIHIAPWPVTEALFAGVSRVLRPHGRLVMYGPYRIDGKQTAPSNARFEEWLKARDPRFAVRDLGEVEAVANRNGLVLAERIAMPANNFLIVWTVSGA